MAKPSCKPNMNGNPPEHFCKAGRLIYSAAGKAIDEIGAALSSTEVFNGRNYQHLPTSEAIAARDADMAEIKKAYAALERLRDFSLEIYKIGEEKS